MSTQPKAFLRDRKRKKKVIQRDSHGHISDAKGRVYIFENKFWFTVGERCCRRGGRRGRSGGGGKCAWSRSENVPRRSLAPLSVTTEKTIGCERRHLGQLGSPAVVQWSSGRHSRSSGCDAHDAVAGVEAVYDGVSFVCNVCNE